MSFDVEENIAETMRLLKEPGLLLVSADKNGKNNVMTIGWGFFGVLWKMPVFIVAVRPTRYTHKCIEDSGEFTVNVPAEGMEDTVQRCGEVSGRDSDKFKECGLSLKVARKLRVPIIEQCKLHFECRVVHKLKVDVQLVPSNVGKSFYSRGDYHTFFFGEILDVY